jgi:hypothetical protein
MATEEPRVVMFHVGRCGSTVVAELLKQHRRITWDGELFEPVIREKLDERDLGAAGLLKARVDQAQDVYGFELKYLPSHHQRILDLSLDDLVDLAEQVGVSHYVTLHRRNYLRRVVSGAIGRERKRWHRKGDEGEPSTITHLDLESIPFGPRKPLLKVFEELGQGEGDLKIRLAAKTTLELTYEDDIESDPLSAYNSICEFAGLEAESVETTLHPTGDRPLSAMVENYAEVESLIKGTRYEWMLTG